MSRSATGQDVVLPELHQVVQRFDQSSLADPATAVAELFASFQPRRVIAAGQSVAVAVGSRGIKGLPVVVASVVRALVSLGLKPHVIPAMGSHGGATARGQTELLAGLGITESAMGAPIRADMAARSIGRLDGGAEVFCAEDALAADHVVVINRIKPHTLFRAEVESGLCKMLAVGLGRRQGAESMHRHGLAASIVPAARMIIGRARLLAGLALVESPSGGIRTMRLVAPEEFPAVDAELLREAWGVFPRLPVDDLDVLVVDAIGKDISGGGMDLNVVGFWRRDGGERRPDYRTILARELTPASHGNAAGIGWADLTTRHLAARIDWNVTRTNAITSGVLASVRLPVVMDDDRAALSAAVAGRPPAEVRLARIADTKNLESFWASPAVAAQLKGRDGLEVEADGVPMLFDAGGRLLPSRHAATIKPDQARRTK